MMAGTKSVIIAVRVSQDTADAIDKARAGQSRAGWVSDAVDLVLSTTNGEQVIPASTVKAAGKREPDACPHPRARVIKGFCYRCGKPAAS